MTGMQLIKPWCYEVVVTWKHALYVYSVMQLSLQSTVPCSFSLEGDGIGTLQGCSSPIAPLVDPFHSSFS